MVFAIRHLQPPHAYKFVKKIATVPHMQFGVEVSFHDYFAMQTLKTGLETRGLEVSLGKTGFLASSVKAKHALSKALQKLPEPPRIRDVLKDLGVDSTLGRRGRIPILGKRLKGAKATLARIWQLPRDSRKKYVHASAFAAGFWGQAAMGMPKQKLHRWRIHIAKT